MFPFLVYVSTATVSMTTADLGVLLEQAQAKNTRLDVTGALLYQHGHFMQILEGDLDTIEDLFTTICADPRHHQVIRLIDGWNDSRQFVDWSMAFDDLTDTNTALGVGLGGLLHAPGDDPSPALARLLMTTFRSTLDRQTQPG